MTRKKLSKRFAERLTEEIIEDLDQHGDLVDGLDQKRIHYFDESSFWGRLIGREYGYAPRGQRINADRYNSGRKHWTLLAVTSIRRGTPHLMWEIKEGGLKRSDFIAFLGKPDVLKTFHRGDILIIDNCRSHRYAGQEMIESIYDVIGVTVWFLPRYFPYINGVEYLFGYCKKQLRLVDTWRRDDTMLLRLLPRLLRRGVDRDLIKSFYKKAMNELQKELDEHFPVDDDEY